MKCYRVEFANGQSTVVELDSSKPFAPQLERLFGIGRSGASTVVKIELLD